MAMRNDLSVLPDDVQMRAAHRVSAKSRFGAGKDHPRENAARDFHRFGRAGRVHVQREGDSIWVGGDVVACISGEVVL